MPAEPCSDQLVGTIPCGLPIGVEQRVSSDGTVENPRAFGRGDGAFATRNSVDDIAGPAEDIGWDSPVNGHAVASKSWIGTFETEDTAIPATTGNCPYPGARLPVPIAASHDSD